MFRFVRAAALAAFAFVSLSATPAAAEGAAGTIYDHGRAGAGISSLGINDNAPAVAATVQTSVTAFRHMVGLADATVPGMVSLEAEVARLAAVETDGAEEDCLANAVYFEARGETLEGQLAVAEVVLNRARSGRYPTTWCGVVTQRAQFSFVRSGVIPRADRSSEAWRRAVAIARIAMDNLHDVTGDNSLFFHATYVRPSWGRPSARIARIGNHIFYR